MEAPSRTRKKTKVESGILIWGIGDLGKGAIEVSDTLLNGFRL